MPVFARKIALQSADTVYYIKESVESDAEHHSILLSVPPQKRALFERAMQEKESIRMEDYGRVMYYGAGLLTERRIGELLTANA